MNDLPVEEEDTVNKDNKTLVLVVVDGAEEEVEEVEDCFFGLWLNS